MNIWSGQGVLDPSGTLTIESLPAGKLFAFKAWIIHDSSYVIISGVHRPKDFESQYAVSNDLRGLLSTELHEHSGLVTENSIQSHVMHEAATGTDTTVHFPKVHHGITLPSSGNTQIVNFELWMEP